MNENSRPMLRPPTGEPVSLALPAALGQPAPLVSPQMPFWLPELIERRARWQAELAAGAKPVSFVAPGYEWTLTTPWEDPAANVTPSTLVPYRTRLIASPPTPWVASSTVTARCPARHRRSPSGGLELLDEPAIKATAIRVRRHSMERDPSSSPLLDRLRALHGRLLPTPSIATDGRFSPWFPTGARHVTLVSGHVAVEDTFAELPGEEPSAWQVSFAADDVEGIVAAIGGAGERRDAIRSSAVILGGVAFGGVADPGFSWVVPDGWHVDEHLLLSTEMLDAQARLERLPAGWGHDEWVRASFDRAPFLRDQIQLSRRPIIVNGMGDGELVRFDWQPSGRGRLLTTVAWAVRDGFGFMFSLEVSLDAADDLLMTDPDALLASINVS